MWFTMTYLFNPVNTGKVGKHNTARCARTRANSEIGAVVAFFVVNYRAVVLNGNSSVGAHLNALAAAYAAVFAHLARLRALVLV